MVSKRIELARRRTRPHIKRIIKKICQACATACGNTISISVPERPPVLIWNLARLASTSALVSDRLTAELSALSDFGEVVLRVRDTGRAMNNNEVAAALEPFRMRSPSEHGSDASAVSLSLTKALVEANRAQFHIRPGPHSGTLVEVVFSRAAAQA